MSKIKIILGAFIMSLVLMSCGSDDEEKKENNQTRFTTEIISGDTVLTDTETKLLWTNSELGCLPITDGATTEAEALQAASDFCEESTFGEFEDWRLATADEMIALEKDTDDVDFELFYRNPSCPSMFGTTETGLTSVSTTNTAPVGRDLGFKIPSGVRCVRSDDVVVNDLSLKLVKRSVSFLVDDMGMSLYVFDNDTLNTSTCSGGCLATWPAFTSDAVMSSEFTEIDETSKHIAYNKHPLYYYASDVNAGDINGDGVGGVWHLVFPAASFVDSDLAKKSTATVEKTYLVDANGMALYTFDEDEDDKSNCSGGCLAVWPVFNAEIAVENLPEGFDASMLKVITREDGAMQVSYNKKPLYYYASDMTDADTKGDWVNGTWHLAEVK